MALEFHKITTQLDQMVRYLNEQEIDTTNKVEIALQILAAYADEAFLPQIHQRVQDAVDRDAGYRGARPLDEPILNTYPPADSPESATIVATDGSQIYPRLHEAVHYYLLNIGTIILHHGSGEPPDVLSEPYLFYDRAELYPQSESSLVTTAIVNARRTVAEMAALSQHAYEQADQARPLLALLDGPLLFVMGNDVPERDQLRKLYFSAMNRLLEFRATLAGYTDNPNSTFITRMLHLLDMAPEEVRRATLSHSGRLEGIKDAQIFETYWQAEERWVLPPGHRTALFVQMSPQNKEFRQRGGDLLEIVFFYMNVAPSGEPPHVARVELPMWVAEDRQVVSELQVLLYDQCQQITKRYPYVLMRADELAYVKSDEQRQLNTMIKVEMARCGLSTDESSKQASKDIARAKRSHFRM